MSYQSNWYIWPLFGCAAGLYFFFRGFKVYRECRVVEDTPPMPIRGIPMGLAHIQGKPSGENRVWSPVSHTPCYFYKVNIEQWKEAEHSSSWSRFATDINGTRFHLEDASGKVAIDARQAEFGLVETCSREIAAESQTSSLAAAMDQKVLGGTEVTAGENNSSGQVGAATDAELRIYISRLGKHVFEFVERMMAGGGPWAMRDPEKRKQALEQPLVGEEAAPEKMAEFMQAQMEKLEKFQNQHGGGEDPAVQARARQLMLEALKPPAAGPDPGEHALPDPGQAPPGPGIDPRMAENVERLRQMMYHPELAFAPAEGRFRLTEYCIVPGQEYNIIGTCMENPVPKDQDDRNLIAKGKHEPTYVISDKARVRVESTLRKRAVLMVFGGAALVVICMGVWLFSLGLF